MKNLKFPNRQGIWSVLGLFVLSGVAHADVLEVLVLSDVATTYTYPDGGDPGVLEFDDDRVTGEATILDGPSIPLDADVALAMNLISEIGDAGDSMASAIFDDGTLVVDENGNPGSLLFQADISGFQLAELGNTGGFLGDGAFTDAMYDGVLGSITAPTRGGVITIQPDWFTDPGLTTPINIDDFETMLPPGTTIYGRAVISITPEPTSLMLFAVVSAIATRRRRIFSIASAK